MEKCSDMQIAYKIITLENNIQKEKREKITVETYWTQYESSLFLWMDSRPSTSVGKVCPSGLKSLFFRSRPVELSLSLSLFVVLFYQSYQHHSQLCRIT